MSEPEAEAEIELEEYIDQNDVLYSEVLSEEDGMDVKYSTSDEEMDEEEREDLDNDEGPIEGKYMDLNENDDESSSSSFTDNSAIVRFKDHTEAAFTVSISPTHPYVVSGGEDNMVYMWNYNTGRPVYSSFLGLSGQENEFNETVGSTAFSSDGVYVAAADLDGCVVVWLSATGERLQVLEDATYEINWIDWHPTEPLLLAGCGDGTAWLWSMPGGECIQAFKGQKSSLTVGGFSPDGKYAIAGADDGSTRVWDCKTGKILWKHQIELLKVQKYGVLDEFENEITSLVITPDSRLIVAGSNNHSIKLCLLQSNRIVGSLEGHQKPVETVAISPTNPHILVSGGADGILNIWDLASSKLRESCDNKDFITKCIFMKDSPLVVTGGLEGAVKVWDSRTGRMEKKFKDHKSTILDLATTTDLIVTASEEEGCCVFSLNK